MEEMDFIMEVEEGELHFYLRLIQLHFKVNYHRIQEFKQLAAIIITILQGVFKVGDQELFI